MDFIRRLFRRLAESDEERLAEDIRSWAANIPNTVRMADAPARTKVRLAGVVRRIRVRPVEGYESLEAQLSDGTGEVYVLWMGRRAIPGLTLGTRLVVEGVLAEQPSGRKMVNPQFEFTT